MTLNDCTKSELLTIIDRLKRRFRSNGEYYLLCALHDVESKREHAKLDKADEIAELANQKRQEYIDLMLPYEGKSFGDIPFPVLSKARTALAEAHKLDKEWNKLMGID